MRRSWFRRTPPIYRDVVQVDGWYGTFHLEDQLELGGSFALHGKLGFGWGDRDYFGVPDDGLNDFYGFVSLSWSRGRWTVKPFVGWHSIVDGTLRSAVASDDNLVYGLSVSATL